MKDYALPLFAFLMAVANAAAGNWVWTVCWSLMCAMDIITTWRLQKLLNLNNKSGGGWFEA